MEVAFAGAAQYPYAEVSPAPADLHFFVVRGCAED
jgi:hypothetical protein